MNEKMYFVFDVESIGLHGDGFAVGWVVITGSGVEITSALIHCSPDVAHGNDQSRDWIKKNIPPLPKSLIPCVHPSEVREQFWTQWLCWKERGALLAADCAWPVEARFLCRCVDHKPDERGWQGPYPLVDVGSVMLAVGMNPLQDYPRLDNELPKHNPLCDARQSARLLIEALRKSRATP